MAEPDFHDLIKEIRRKDPRFSAEAYAFTFQALQFTMEVIKGQRGHVTGQELLEGIRRMALREFGRLAPMVFRSWGVKGSRDFGEVVWNMVESGVMGKKDEDKLDDFTGGWDIETAFEKEEEGDAGAKETE